MSHPLASPDYPQLLAEWLTPAERAESLASRAQALSFVTDDGRTLRGQLFHPLGERRGGILIGGATGVPQGFYRAYAGWLAGRGYTVMTFDYRGIGDSRDRPLAQDPARMRDWGLQDLPAALEVLAEQVGGAPLALIGHSVGGQMIGAMPNHGRLRAAVQIACGLGYWRGMPAAYGAMVYALIAGLGPLLYRRLGYAPNSRIGWGEDLPRGVAEDWFRWCQRADYFAELRTPEQPLYFDAVRLPLLSLAFTDDPIATAANVEGLLGFYPQAAIERRRLAPAGLGLRSIGHLQFFSRRMPEALWRQPLDWLEAQLAR
ncbi:MAG TPA: alpha/beta fold hydrolase [Nevskiaceae bacterium]|nr:alpha/beta fold hydrolase [Nevskiaceae bacterium]